MLAVVGLLWSLSFFPFSFSSLVCVLFECDMALPDTPPMSIPPSPPTPAVLDLSGLFCCTTKFGHLPEGVVVSQVLEEAVEDEIVEFGILPLRSGERKVVKRSMNRTLFTTFCVKQLNSYVMKRFSQFPLTVPNHQDIFGILPQKTH